MHPEAVVVGSGGSYFHWQTDSDCGFCFRNLWDRGTSCIRFWRTRVILVKFSSKSVLNMVTCLSVYLDYPFRQASEKTFDFPDLREIVMGDPARMLISRRAPF